MFAKLICSADEMNAKRTIIKARHMHFLRFWLNLNKKKRLNVTVSFDLFIKIIEILAFYRVPELY